MSKTGQQLIDLALSHLGDRSSGKIGSKTVLEAGIDTLNSAFLQLAKEYDSPALQHSLSIAVSNSAYEYDLPTLDNDSNAIRIKSFVAQPRILRDGETSDYQLPRVSKWKGAIATITPTSDRASSPRYYSKFANKIQIVPWPDTDYTLTIYVNVWPKVYAAANLTTEHEYGAEWDSTLEYFMAWELFTKLQQLEDANFFRQHYINAKRDTIQAVTKNNDLLLGSSLPHVGSFIDVTEQPSGTGTYRDLETGQVI